MSDWTPRAATVAIVEAARDVLAEADLSGYRFTLRRVFYALVSANVIPNTERAYKNLSATLDRARWEGWIDMDAIDDLGRVAAIPPAWDSPADLVEDAAAQFRSDWWANACPLHTVGS